MVKFKLMVLKTIAFLLLLPIAIYAQKNENIIFNDYTEIKNILKKSSKFEQVFEKTMEIKINLNEIIIGTINKLDVNSKGEFLIFDETGPNLILINKYGKLIRIINPSKDIPGIKWKPQLARFLYNDSILVRSGGNHLLFLFNENGDYLKNIPVRFPFQYKDFVIIPQNYIVGYSILPNRFSLKKINFEGSIISEGGIFSDKYKNFLERQEETGPFIIYHNDCIYQMNSYSNEIYKLSLNLKHIKTYSNKSLPFKQLKEDLPILQDNYSDFISKSNKLMHNSTFTKSVHFLSNNLLIIEYFELGKRHSFYFDIFSFDGQFLISSKISYSFSILASRDYYIYKSFQPDPDKNGTLPNPIIIEYRFKNKPNF